MTVNALLKKIHIYLGLLNLSILLIFGIAGFVATVQIPGERWEHLQRSAVVRVEEFTVPTSLIDDQAVADYIRRHLNIAKVEGNVRRDGENNLVFTYYTHNGPRAVTLLEKDNQIRVSTVHNAFYYFLDNLHATSSREAEDWRVQLWAYYNELSIWSLIAMALTGIYLWVSSRPRYLWAHVSFWTGSGAFVLLYWLTR